MLQTAFTFQANGLNVTNEVTANQTSIHQFANGVYVGKVDPSGTLPIQVLNSDYRALIKADGNNNGTTFAWSTGGKLLNQVTDALGNQTSFNYNSGGASADTLNYSLDAQGRKTQYTYGDSVNPRLPTRITVIDVDGITVLSWQEFSYDSKGRTLTQKTFDVTGTIVQQETDQAYYTSGNGNGLLQTVTQKDLLNPANNVTTTYFYDAFGRLIRTNQSATFGSCTSSFTLYDTAGNVIAAICNYDPGMGADPTTVAQAIALFNPAVPDKNKVTTYGYDTLGRRVQTTTDAGALYAQTALTVYDSLNRVVRTIANYVADAAVINPYTAARAVFKHGPDNTENLITETAYNERGAVKTQTDVLGTVTLYGYDASGRLTKTAQSASQPAYDNSYGPTGDPSLSKYVVNNQPDQDIVTTSLYDAAGNLVQAMDMLGNVTFTVYDALNRPVQTVRSASVPNYNWGVDPALLNYPFSSAPDMDMVDLTEYDALSRVRRTQDSLGSWTLFGYDSLGRPVKTVRYASLPNYNLIVDPSLSQYIPSVVPDLDLISQTFYDTAGRVMYTADPLNRQTWSAYDGLGRNVRTIANPTGSATDGSLSDPRNPYYDRSALPDQDLVSRTDYDSSGRVWRTQDTLGNWTLAGYDAVNRQIRTVRNASNFNYSVLSDPGLDRYMPAVGIPIADQDLVSQTSYDAQGRVSISADPLGNQTKYGYDSLSRRTTLISNFVSGTYNSARPDQDLSSTTSYDLAGRISTTTDVRGTQTTFTYDRVGRQLTVTRAAGTGQATTSYTCYDKAARVFRTIQNWSADPRQPSPDAKDDRGNWLFAPTAYGSANDQNVLFTFSLDKLGRQTATRDPLGNTTLLAYYKDGQLESMTDALGVVTKYRYDRQRRRIAVVQSFQDNGEDPALWVWNINTVRWEKSNGTAIAFGAAQDQNVIAQAEYDKVSRLAAVRDPRGNRTTYTYDRLNRRTSLTDPLAHAWGTAYARLSSGAMRTIVTDPLGNQTQQDTDRVGHVAHIQYLSDSPKLTPDITLSYDKLGRRTQMSETNGASTVRGTTYAYDQASRLSGVGFDTNGDGMVDQTVGYAYDAGGLRTQLVLPDGKTLVYQYDAKQQLTGLTDWSSQFTRYSYDSSGRLVGIDRSNALRSIYAYDAGGRVQSLRHAAGNKTLGYFAYQTDKRGNRTQVYEAVPQAGTGTTSLAYNDPGVSYFLGIWTAAAPYQVTTNFSAALQAACFGSAATLTMGQGPDQSVYDIHVDGDLWQTIDGYAAAAGDTALSIAFTGEGPHLLEIRNRSDKNAASSGYKLRFKSLSMTGRQYDLQTVQYSYDALARLTQAKSTAGINTGAAPSRQYTYAYDVAGNRTQQVVTLSGSPTTTNYSYDNANRLTSDGTHTFGYDTAGRMTSDGVNTYAWDRANRLLSMGSVSSLYNGDGQRVQQTVSAIVTQYLLDVQPGLWKVLQATAGANTTRYVHGPTGLQQQQNPDASWRWSILDALGSVRGVVDVSVVPQESRLYDPYGSQSQTSGSQQTVFGFTGEETDGSGLLNLRARYYNPALGQFLNLDPLEGGVGRPNSLNRYAYVQDNPINWTDPTGMTREDPHNYDKCKASCPCCGPDATDWIHREIGLHMAYARQSLTFGPLGGLPPPGPNDLFTLSSLIVTDPYRADQAIKLASYGLAVDYKYVDYWILAANAAPDQTQYSCMATEHGTHPIISVCGKCQHAADYGNFILGAAINAAHESVALAVAAGTIFGLSVHDKSEADKQLNKNAVIRGWQFGPLYNPTYNRQQFCNALNSLGQPPDWFDPKGATLCPGAIACDDQNGPTLNGALNSNPSWDGYVSKTLVGGHNPDGFGSPQEELVHILKSFIHLT